MGMNFLNKILLILGGLLLIGVGFGQLNPEQRYENARWVSGEFVEMEEVRRGRWNNARYEISLKQGSTVVYTVPDVTRKAFRAEEFREELDPGENISLLVDADAGREVLSVVAGEVHYMNLDGVHALRRRNGYFALFGGIVVLLLPFIPKKKPK